MADAAVTVIGDATLDIHASPLEPMRAGGDVSAVIQLEPGGQGANVAVRLARRGVATRLVCAIGDDPAGGILREHLAAEGVEVAAERVEATGMVVVLRDGGGERSMLSQRSRLRPAGPAPTMAPGWVIVSGYALREWASHVRAGTTQARRALIGRFLDAHEVDSWAAAATVLAPHLLVTNADEASVLTASGGRPADLALHLADRFGVVAIVTHRDGAAASLDGRPIEVAAPQVEGNAVDTTGAGDAFAAGLVASLAETAWPPDAAELGAAMTEGVILASAVTRVAGAQARVPAERGR